MGIIRKVWRFWRNKQEFLEKFNSRGWELDPW